MTTTHIVAFALYLAVLAALLYYGVIYLLQRTFMPYHQAAVGKKWEELDPRLQALLTGMQEIMGAGMLTPVAAGLFILFVPFRRGEPWASWAMLAMLLVLGLPTIYATRLINRRTGADTPVLPSVVSVVVSVLAFVVSQL